MKKLIDFFDRKNSIVTIDFKIIYLENIPRLQRGIAFNN